MSKKNQGNQSANTQDKQKEQNPKPENTKVEDDQQTVETNKEQVAPKVETGSEGSGSNEGPKVSEEDANAGDNVANQIIVEQPGAGKKDEEEPEVEGELNPNCQTILAYAIAMAPNKPNDKMAILRKQMELYQAVTAIINNLEGAEFHKAYNEALEIMTEYKTTFADNLLFRGFTEMRIAAASRARFENILVLMSSTADPEGRAAALKAISFETFAKDFGADVEQKIRGFYR